MKHQHMLDSLPCIGERLELRQMLSAIGFAPREVAAIEIHTVRSAYVADLDGDSDVDLLVATSNLHPSGNKVVWYENVDGKGTFGSQKIIARKEVNAVLAADLDGDGDIDVLTSHWNGGVFWHENIDGKGTFGSRRLVATDGAREIIAADLDKDGAADVILGSGNKITWYKNTDRLGTFRQQQTITTSANSATMRVADMDGDGNLDILLAAPAENNVNWYRNTDGKGSFGSEQIATITSSHQRSTVSFSDLDGDGDNDLISAAGPGLAWYENLDGNGTFGPPEMIFFGESTNMIQASDIDGDGDADVLSRLGDFGLVWFENTDGGGQFGQPHVIADGDWTEIIYASDLDADGDTDVFSASSSGKLVWYENTAGVGTNWRRHFVTTEGKASSAHAADLDADGDLDVLSASAALGLIAWRENTDGNGHFGDPQVITTDINTHSNSDTSIYAADLDDDGDLDVISAYESRRQMVELAWYENTDGKATFGDGRVIAQVDVDDRWPTTISVFAADLNSDGDVDLLAHVDWRVFWLENVDGTGQLTTQHIIAETWTQGERDRTVYAADLDADGDLDVLAGSPEGGLAWYENIDGEGTFETAQLILDDEVGEGIPHVSILASDLDADGDFDVLLVSEDKVSWHENTNGKGHFGAQQIIATAPQTCRCYKSVDAADWDSDGDLDVVATRFSYWGFGIFLGSAIDVYENTDGHGAFELMQSLPTTDAQGPASIRVADVDGDGDNDMLVVNAGSIDTAIMWYESRLIGDVDDDGKVAFADFLRLANNFGRLDAVWEDGDFDGNGSVDFSDFLMLSNNFDIAHQKAATAVGPGEVTYAVDASQQLEEYGFQVTRTQSRSSIGKSTRAQRVAKASRGFRHTY